VAASALVNAAPDVAFNVKLGDQVLHEVFTGLKRQPEGEVEKLIVRGTIAGQLTSQHGAVIRVQDVACQFFADHRS
jgi:hypothetical protein